MSPVKGRHATLLKKLGALFSAPPHKPLDYSELAELLGTSEDAVKTWARRGLPAWAKLRLLEIAEARGAAALQEAKDLLQGVTTGPGVPAAARTVAEPGRGPSGGGAGRDVASASFRTLEAQEALWKGFRVLASRIARTVQQTIIGNELGYTRSSREILADSLELFAKELDRRCGEVVSGDIWQVVAWLRKPEEKPHGHQ